MTIREFTKKTDWSPKSNQVDKETLKLLLKNVKHTKLFCWHHWVYWNYGSTTRLHRICKKCYKKQKNIDVINNYTIWIKE